ncbi:MAG: 50S ribosomal protein L19 [Flavobacteriaceae bacterium]
MEALINFVQNEFIEQKEIPAFSTGDTLTVYYDIREGEKVRTQFFKGVVIQIKGEGLTKTFTIRKMSGTVGVERIFPINLPSIQKIEINKKGKVRQSRIYYFKKLRGKKARIKEVQKES